MRQLCSTNPRQSTDWDMNTVLQSHGLPILIQLPASTLPEDCRLGCATLDLQVLPKLIHECHIGNFYFRRGLKNTSIIRQKPCSYLEGKYIRKLVGTPYQTQHVTMRHRELVRRNKVNLIHYNSEYILLVIQHQ